MNIVIQPGKKEAPVFILLHGTGGNEESLLDVGKVLNPNATLVGIRGAILEQGYPRYFRRLEEGVYDIEDLNHRAIELHNFVQELITEYEFDKSKIVLVGYSNGANIGIKLLLDYSDMYPKGILFHPMYPVEINEKQDLSQTNLFMTMGKMDPIVSVQDSEYVLELFKERQATVDMIWTQGHQLTYEEVLQGKEWLEK